MSELWPITIISIILAGLSHYRSVRTADLRGYVRKELFFFVFLVIVMVFFVGLRTRYNDTTAYTHAYNLIQGELSELQNYSRELGDNPGFNLINWLLVRLGFSAQSFLMFYAAVTIAIYLWFIRQYSCNFLLSVFLFITMGCYTFTLAAIKQCVAVAIALLGVHQYLRGHKIRFVVGVLVAALFHPYALMFLLVPLLCFRPWSGGTYLMLVLFVAAGFLLQYLVGPIIDVTTLLGEEFTTESFTSDGINPFRLAVVTAPVLVSFVVQRSIAQRNDRVNHLMMNLSTLNAAIMFVGLFGTANYFGRLANYFLIFQTISLPWLITHFDKRSRQAMNGIVTVCYLAYFYYANAINQSFDAQYSAVTLGEYLKSLF